MAAFFLEALEDFDLADDHFLEGKELVHAELEIAGRFGGVDLAFFQTVEHGLDFRLGAARGQDIGREIALAVVHLPHVILHRFDDPINEGLFQLDVAQAGDDFLFEADDFLLGGRDPPFQGATVVQLPVDLAFFLEDLLDFVQQQDDPRALVHFIFAGVVLFNGFNHILELDAVLAQILAHIDEFFHGHGHFHQGVEHVLFAHFDLFGDDHFAVAVQQGHGAHFAQIHAHGVGAAGGVVG